jgi:hypothetical protein
MDDINFGQYNEPMEIDAVIRQLRDTDAVVANVQSRQAAALEDKAEWQANQDKRQLEFERRVDEHDRWWVRHTQAMAEFDDKPNGVIAIVDDMIRGKQR